MLPPTDPDDDEVTGQVVMVSFGTKKVVIDELPEFKFLPGSFGPIPQRTGEFVHNGYVELVGSQNLDVVIPGVCGWMLAADGSAVKITPDGKLHVYK